jgi:hypothetical protein
MSLFRSAKDKLVGSRMQEEALHAAALREYESGVRRDGLWAKAIIESSGNAARTESIYLRELVLALRDEIYVEARTQQIARDATAISPSGGGGASLLPASATFGECEGYARKRGWTFRCVSGVFRSCYVLDTKKERHKFLSFGEAVAWLRADE